MPRDTLGGAEVLSGFSSPYPDPENPGHYLNMFKTPTTINDGQQRPVDDFAPRANLKQLFKDGAILSGDSENVKEVESLYFVEEKHVLGYIRHLEELQVVSAIREEDQKKKRAADNNKAYKDYNWDITSGKLATLKVKELEKYLKEHNLSFMGKKEDKIKRIRSDFNINRAANTDPEDDV